MIADQQRRVQERRPATVCYGLTILKASPGARAFFGSLAQFYRKGYLLWIDATKRRPDVRAERIAEVVRLLNAGVKGRPQAP